MITSLMKRPLLVTERILNGFNASRTVIVNLKTDIVVEGGQTVYSHL